MSCNYADGLSPYDNKGVLGLAEQFDSQQEVWGKCEELAKLIKEAKHVVVHTGAGISTSAGIPDFRGPKGVWTLEEKGLKPDVNISFSDAKPTKTHMAIKTFIERGLIHYIVSQNIDGLHLKSGVSREHVAELHGNMFVDQCNFCKRLFVRRNPTPTVGLKLSSQQCKGEGRPCRGKLQDTILDWEGSLPDDDLELSDLHSSLADLSICMGTTLQIVPSGNIPLNTLKYGGKLVICNLQPTKHDNKADLVINTYIDDIMESVSKILGITIPEYTHDEDPTSKASTDVLEWTIKKSQIVEVKTKQKSRCSGIPKKRVVAKRPNDYKNRGKAPTETKKRKSIETPKPTKIPKVKKTKKEVKRDEEEDDIIVINEEDGYGSDIICIDDEQEQVNDDNTSVTLKEMDDSVRSNAVKLEDIVKSADSKMSEESKETILNGKVDENNFKSNKEESKHESWADIKSENKLKKEEVDSNNLSQQKIKDEVVNDSDNIETVAAHKEVVKPEDCEKPVESNVNEDSTNDDVRKTIFNQKDFVILEVCKKSVESENCNNAETTTTDLPLDKVESQNNLNRSREDVTESNAEKENKIDDLNDKGDDTNIVVINNDSCEINKNEEFMDVDDCEPKLEGNDTKLESNEESDKLGMDTDEITELPANAVITDLNIQKANNVDGECLLDKDVSRLDSAKIDNTMDVTNDKDLNPS